MKIQAGKIPRKPQSHTWKPPTRNHKLLKSLLNIKKSRLTLNPALLCSGPFSKHRWPPPWRGEEHCYPQIKHCARAAQEQVYPKLPLQLSNGHQEPSWPLPSRGTWRVLVVGYTTASGWSCMSDYGARCGRAWHRMSQKSQRCCTWDGVEKRAIRKKKGGRG